MARQLSVKTDGAEWMVTLDGDRATLEGAGASFVVREEPDGRYRVAGAGADHLGVASRSADTIWISIDGHSLPFRVSRGAAGGPATAHGHDVLTPPMPATVVRIAVRAGDPVKAGDTLIVLEAMKMELPIRAPRDATVAAVHCVEGQMVQPDQNLIDLT